METVKKTATKIKNHVGRNKVAYTLGAITVTVVVAANSNRKAFYKFLEEKGIDPMEYYASEFYKEKVSQVA